MFPSDCFKVTLIGEIHRRTEIVFYFKDDICTVTTVTTCRTSFWYVLFATKGNHSISSVATFYIYLDLIYKHFFFTPFYILAPAIAKALLTYCEHKAKFIFRHMLFNQCNSLSALITL